MNFCNECEHMGGDPFFPFCKKTLYEKIDYTTKNTIIEHTMCLFVRQGENEKHCKWFEPRLEIGFWDKVKSFFSRKEKQ